MSTAVSTPPPSLPGSHYPSNNIAIPPRPKATSSAIQSTTLNTHRDMNHQRFQNNQTASNSSTLRTPSASTAMTDSVIGVPRQEAPTPNSHQEDGSVSEPSRRTGQPELPKNKKKGRQPGKNIKNRTASQPGGLGSPALARPTSTGNGSNTTPSRPLGTPPKQAYAGPTFHASPAPSALPIPRFFSKSVPEPASSNGLQRKLEESSSDASDSSPTPVATQMAGQQQAREESPLDIFFRADREEKAKVKNSTPLATPLRGTSSTTNSLSPSPPSNLPSPFEGSSRQHSRHPTGGSAGDMFALEMDGGDVPNKKAVSAAPHAQGDRKNAPRSNTAPSNMISQNSQAEEQRRAKTQALKNLLLSPQPQRPASSSSSPRYGGSAYELDGTPESSSPSPSPRGNSSSRHVSSTPTTTPASDETKKYSRRSHHGSFPFLHESLLATANGSPKPVSRSSNLRQELSPTMPQRGILPTELTTPPSYKSSKQFNTFDASSNSQNSFDARVYQGSIGTTHSQSLGAQSPASLHGPGASATHHTKRKTTDLRVMEDDLRRILKMDILNGAGVSGLANGASTGAASSENRFPLNGTRDRVSGF